MSIWSNSIIIKKSVNTNNIQPQPKQVNFIDYDGTILYAYSGVEANALTALPPYPSHNGLIAQGWNWTLAEIKTQLTEIPEGPIWVGQMYITQSGDTEIDINIRQGRRSPTLTIAVNGTVSVYWGDNTTFDSINGSSLTTRQQISHTYATEGKYTIKIHVVNGNFTFYGSSSYTLLRKNTSEGENIVYANCVQNIRLGNRIANIGYSAFYNCHSLKSITIPETVTALDTNAFYNCISLKSITIPYSVTSIGSYAFNSCRSLMNIAIPINMTNINASAFVGCYALMNITIPLNITNIGNYAFNDCINLTDIIIPNGIDTIKTGVFRGCTNLTKISLPVELQSIWSYAFYNCKSLIHITIPDTVSYIEGQVFNGCWGIVAYYIKPTEPPTINYGTFSLASDCLIYVPAASLDAYKTASNWSSLADKMVGE